MAIIYARRIPHGLSGAESCGPDQQFDPNLVFQGIKGQCIPKTQALTPAPKPGFFESFSAGLSTFFPKPGIVSPAVMPFIPQQQQGVSPTMLMLLGVGALGLILLATSGPRSNPARCNPPRRRRRRAHRRYRRMRRRGRR